MFRRGWVFSRVCPKADSQQNFEAAESGQTRVRFRSKIKNPSHERVLCTVLRQGAASRNRVPEKKGVRARHGLRAPCQSVRIECEAAWGTRGHLPRTCFPYPLSS